jgi:cytidylate kinase
VIAIDGPAASGKSTTARLTAERLGFAYLDTGAMYRAAALLASRLGIDGDDGELVASLIRDHSIRTDGRTTLLDGEDVSLAIRSTGIGDAASVVSAHPGVRRAMVSLQKQMGAKGSTVAEGRDMGTVVFPGARLKVYVVADLAVRLQRRMRELRDRGERLPGTAELVTGMLARDRRDRERADSPLRMAPGAVWLDTSLMTVSEQVTAVVALWTSRCAEEPTCRA